MFTWTQITNVSFVDDPRTGARLWAKFLLIDEPKKEGDRLLDGIRQVRGFTNGGMSVFTYWIPAQAEVKFENRDGTIFTFRGGQELKAIDGGVNLIVDELKLGVCCEDRDQPIEIRKIHVDSCPHGSEVDEEILKYYSAPNYCVTAYVRREEALATAQRLQARF